MFLINGCAESPDNQLIGEWKSIDSTGVTLFFNDDGTFLFLEGGIVKGGESEGDTATWNLDAGHDPVHLDIIITDKQGKTGITPSIIRFLGKNKIQIYFADDDGERPVKFTQSKNYNQILYERQ